MNFLSGARRAAAVLAVSATLAFPAAAQQVMNEPTPQSVARVMDDMGLDTEIHPASGTRGPYISSQTGDAGFQVRFDACDPDGTGCELIIFAAGFSFDSGNDHLSHERMNEWNDTKWGKAKLDFEDDPWLMLEINVLGGVTRDNLKDTISWWEDLVADFIEFIDWEPL
jgi:hypothetical protein